MDDLSSGADYSVSEVKVIHKHCYQCPHYCKCNVIDDINYDISEDDFDELTDCYHAKAKKQYWNAWNSYINNFYD